jgi:hypothetical protein
MPYVMVFTERKQNCDAKELPTVPSLKLREREREREKERERERERERYEGRGGGEWRGGREKLEVN